MGNTHGVKVVAVLICREGYCFFLVANKLQTPAVSLLFSCTFSFFAVLEIHHRTSAFTLHVCPCTLSYVSVAECYTPAVIVLSLCTWLTEDLNFECQAAGLRRRSENNNWNFDERLYLSATWNSNFILVVLFVWVRCPGFRAVFDKSSLVEFKSTFVHAA